MARFSRFLEKLESYADLECLVSDGESYTYAQLSQQRALWVTQIASKSLRPGTVVGLRSDYSLASIGAFLALLESRAVVALIPRDREVRGYLDDARVSVLLEVGQNGEVHWQTRPEPPPHELLSRVRDSGDAGVVLFTSGSTGMPKAALQSLERFLHKFDKPGRRYRTLAFLLFDHVAGIDTLFYTLANGGTLVTTRDRTPDAICDLIESARVEVLPASPSFLRLMCLRAGASDRDLGTLKIITYGSEPMDPSTLARLGSQFPNVEIIQKYGTTETGSPRSKSRGRDSLWLRIKSSELETRVVDEILYIRSEGMILGYLNAPSPIDEDGWYCTGDLVDVETDSDGEWIRFRGRASDAINVGGEKVSPAEVEQTILELPFVKDAVVRGEPHAMLGQIVTARVTLIGDTDEKTATKQIRKRCRARLAPYKVPVKIAIVADGLTSDRQKALRRTP
jgi:acyl-CoA synthetase (AMP-forming)/AMP-acid ligase II